MPWSLSFSTLTEYDSGQPGINVPDNTRASIHANL